MGILDVRTGLSFGSLRLQSRYLLAPLAGYTLLPFRLLVRRCGGVGLATTDLVSARALVAGSEKTLKMIETCPDDSPLAVQIYGAEAADLIAAARLIEERGIAAIDINMGCPVKKVTSKGGGSALMCDPDATARLVEKVVSAVSIPVTVKMRLGWDDSLLTAPILASRFEACGVAAVIVHGRTREQGFSGQVNLDGIRAVVESVRSIPVIGNGDVRTVTDAERMFRQTGCHGISIGRGALLNPWLFRQLVRWETRGDPGPPAGYDERLQFMEDHFTLLLEQRGERAACLSFRKVANWYCKVLRPGRAVQQELVMIGSAERFYRICEELRQRGEPPHWWRHGVGVDAIKVPKGPIAHW